MRVARFVHPSPLPARSYWAIYDDAEQPVAVFSVGDGNLFVEHVLGPRELACLFDWVRELLPAMEWPQIMVGMTLAASVFVVPSAPQQTETPPVVVQPARRKRPRPKPSVARFLKKRLTTRSRRR